jgi:hypothetical protein
MKRFGSALLVASTMVVTVHGSARAQDAASRVAGEVLFDEGRALVKAGNLDEACPKFAESQRMAPAVGTLLNLGDCYEKTHRIASAWAAFREGAELASHAGQDERATYARDRASKLVARLARLKVEVPEEAKAQSLEVRRGDHVLNAAEWGVAVPVDEGTLEIRATAQGKKAWSTQVAVAEAESKSVSVPPLVDEEKAPPPPVAAPEPGSAAPAADADAHKGSGQRALGLAAAGVGLVGIVVGSVAGLSAKSKNDDALTHCTGNLCDQTGLSLTHDAKSAASLSTIAFIVGAGMIAGGAALWLTAPRDAEPGRKTAKQARLEGGASVDPSGVRFSLRGTW